MFVRTRTLPLAMAAGIALSGLVAPQAEALTPAAAPAVSYAAAHPAAKSPTRQSKVERQAVSHLNALRKKRKVRHIGMSSCLNKVMGSIALRSAKAGRPAAWTKADNRAIAKCGGKRGITHRSVWGAERSAVAFVNRAVATKRLRLGKNEVLTGAGAYRDRRGVLWMAVTEAHAGR